jgi:hypothetical protein
VSRLAIEHGNLTVAEATVREIGAVSLEEALALTALVAQKEPDRRSAFAIRWLRRLLDEDRNLTVTRPSSRPQRWRRSEAGGTRRRTRRLPPWLKERLDSRAGTASVLSRRFPRSRVLLRPNADHFLDERLSLPARSR